MTNLPPLSSVNREFSRMTIVSTIHYEHTGDQPTSIQMMFADLLNSDEEEVYSRRCKATESYQPFDYGFVRHVGLIIIENIEGKNLQVNPTEKEAKAIADKILEVAAQGCNPLLIRPRRHLYMEHSNPSQLAIRCQSGDAKFRLTVIPK